MSYIGRSPNVNRLRLNPRSTDPVNPTEGDLQYADGSARPEGLWVYQNGAWKRVAESTGSGINYASAFFDGQTVSGINQYNDGASPTPVDGTGGTPAGLTTSLNTVTPLRGLSSQRFSKDGSDRQGMGWSWDFTLDRVDYEGSRPEVIQFRYKTSANYVNNDIRLFVYDKDAGVLLNVTSLNGDGSLPKADETGLYTGFFYPNSANNDYRLIWHIASTTAAAYDVDWIDLAVGPDQVVPGAIVTEWVDFTPTGSWVTNTTYTGRWRRVGDSAEIEWGWSLSGAPTAANLTLNLPPGLLIDTAKLTGTSDRFLGKGQFTDSGVNQFEVSVTYNSTSSVVVRALRADATYTTTSQIVNATIPFSSNTGDFGNVRATVPIQGWAASAALSTTEAMLSTAAFRTAGSPTATVTGTPSTIVWSTTPSIDNVAGYSTATGIYTIRKSGVYRFTAAAAVAGTYAVSQFSQIDTLLNGATTLQSDIFQVLTASTTTLYLKTTGIARFSAGDNIRVQVRSNATTPTLSGGANLNYFNVEEIPDFSVFSTYGQFELLTATSAQKTPTASGNYHLMSGNSITLTPGTWKLYGQGFFATNGSNPAYSQLLVGWYGANGADTTSVPTLLSAISGVTVLSSNSGATVLNATTNDNRINTETVVIRTTVPVTAFLVPSSSQTTSANARITVYANAERVQ